MFAVIPCKTPHSTSQDWFPVILNSSRNLLMFSHVTIHVYVYRKIDHVFYCIYNCTLWRYFYSSWLGAGIVTCAKWYAMQYYRILYIVVVRDHVEISLNYERVVCIKLWSPYLIYTLWFQIFNKWIWTINMFVLSSKAILSINEMFTMMCKEQSQQK